MKVGDKVISDRSPFWMTVTGIKGDQIETRFGSEGTYAGTYTASELRPWDGTEPEIDTLKCVYARVVLANITDMIQSAFFDGSIHDGERLETSKRYAKETVTGMLKRGIIRIQGE